MCGFYRAYYHYQILWVSFRATGSSLRRWCRKAWRIVLRNLRRIWRTEGNGLETILGRNLTSMSSYGYEEHVNFVGGWRGICYGQMLFEPLWLLCVIPIIIARSTNPKGKFHSNYRHVCLVVNERFEKYFSKKWLFISLTEANEIKIF